MHRELTIERRGELFHLRFHDYMGPWEGHQIEAILDLEEVDPPADDAPTEDVLGENQGYLWHPMDFAPELHARVTADRLPRVAQIVRDRDVAVVEGADLLPEPPTERLRVDPGAGKGTDSYVARIEARHRPSWARGPKAMAGAFLLRVVPLLLVVYGVVVIGRHAGDHHEAVTLGGMFARAQTPHVEQSAWERWNDPDHTAFVRHQVRRIRYANGETMIVGDGHVLEFVGAGDVTPWLDRVRFTSSPLVIDAVAADGRVAVEQVRCGGRVLAEGMELRRIAHVAASPSPPRRDDSGDPGTFRPVARLDPEADASLESLEGEAICVKGRIVRQDGRRVLRTDDGPGIALDLRGVGPRLATFVDALTDRDCPVQVDMIVESIRPRRAFENEDARERVVGTAKVMSVSAQNHHVLGPRMAS